MTGGTSSGLRRKDPCTYPSSERPSGSAREFFNKAEAWLQDLPLGEQFAGAWQDPIAGRVYVAFAGAGAVEAARQRPELAEMTGDPRVVLVERPFTQKELDAAMIRTASALQELFSEDRPQEGRQWPFSASVCVIDNTVDVALEESASRSRRAEIEEAFEQDMGKGRVRIWVRE